MMQPPRLPESQVEQAVLSGDVSLPKGKPVQVISPDGIAGTIPGEQLKDALEAGYKFETTRRRSIREFVEANDNLSGKVKVALGQFADEALLGLPETVAKYTNPLETEKWEALKDKHSTWNTAGGLAGFAAGFAIGSPVFKAASKAGEATSKIVASRLSELGVDRGSQSLAKQIVARTAANSAKFGVEGAVISAPRAVTETMLGDPEAAAESLLAGIGFGSALGLVSGSVPPLLKKLKKSGERAIRNQSFIPLAQDAQGALGATDEALVDLLAKQKQNAPEIRKAFERIGLQAPEGAISDNKLIQNLDASLRKSPTSVGVERNAMYAQILDKTEDMLRKTLVNEAAPTSARDAGNAIRAVIGENVKARYQPLEQAYASLKQTAQGISLPDDARLKFYDRAVGYALKDNSAYAERIKAYANKLISQDRAVGFESILGELSDDINALYRAGRDNERLALRGLRDLAEEFLETQVERQAQDLAKSGVKEFEKLAAEYLTQKEVTKKGYAGFKQFMNALGDVSRVRGKGVQRFMSALNDELSLPGEKLVERLFDKKNAAALEFVKREIPEAFDLLMAQKRNELVAKHTFDGQLKIGGFLREVDKLSDDVQRLLFPAEAQANVKAAKTIYESLPKDLNPSGTAQAMDINPLNPFELFNATTRTLADRAKLSFVKRFANREGIFVADEAIINTRSKLSDFDNILEKMKLGRSKPADPSLSGLRALDALTGQSSKTEERVQKAKEFRGRVAEIVSDPSRIVSLLSEVGEGLVSGGAPTVGAVFNQKMQNTLDYVQSITPKSPTQASPFYKNPGPGISDVELAKFERKMSVIQNPFVVLPALIDGTLTIDHVEALKTVYPLIYMALRNRIMDQLIEKQSDIAYQDRLKLSLLMGVNVDNSTAPQAIASYQSAWAGVNVDAEMDKGDTIPAASQITAPDTYRTPTDRQLTR